MHSESVRWNRLKGNTMSFMRPILSLLQFLFTALLLACPVRADVLKDFSTDGCSSAPDGIWFVRPNAFFHCCLIHDIAYWKGGTRDEKSQADTEFRSCISKRSHELVGSVYYSSVRSFGSAKTSFSFRWGYGWQRENHLGPPSNPYRPLTDREKQMAEEKLKLVDWDDIARPFFEGDGIIYGQ